MNIGIYRAIGGISLNGREWLLADDGDIMKFESHEKAMRFLIDKSGLNISNENDMDEYGIWTDEIPKEEGTADGN